MKQTVSRTTKQASFSMFGPFTIANFIMVAGVLFLLISQPKYGSPDTYWAAVVFGLFMLVALAFIIKGGLRLRNVRRSASEDRRRNAAGLPLDPEDRRDAGK